MFELATAVLAVRMLPRRWMLAPLTLLAACALVSGDVRTFGEFALEYLLALAGIACSLAFCAWFARNNYLAYALVLGLLGAIPALSELLQSGNAGLEMQGWIVVAVVVAAIAWAVALGLLPSAGEPHGSAPVIPA